MLRAVLLLSASVWLAPAAACMPEGVRFEHAGTELHLADPACPPADRTWTRWCIGEACYDDQAAAFRSLLERPGRLASALYRYTYQDHYGNVVVCTGDRHDADCRSARLTR